MRIYDIQWTDGKIYSVEAAEGTPEDQLFAAVRQHLAQNEQAGFWQSFGESAGILKKSAVPAAQYAAAPTGDEEARKKLLEAQASPGGHTSFQDVREKKDLPTTFDWARQTLGTSMGYLAAPAVAAIGAKALPTALTRSPNLAAKAAGFGTLGAQYLIENLGRQASEQERQAETGEALTPTSPGKAALGAAGQTALDAIGIKFFQPVFSKFPVLGRLYGTEGRAAIKETEDQLLTAYRNGQLSLGNGVLRGVAEGVAFEVPQEIGQQIIERAQAGLSLGDEEARKEYLEAGAGALLLGTGLGSMGKLFNNHNKTKQAQAILHRIKLEDQQKADKKREEEQAAAKAAKEAQAKVVEAEKEQAKTAAVSSVIDDIAKKKGVTPEQVREELKQPVVENLSIADVLDKASYKLVANTTDPHRISAENIQKKFKDATPEAITRVLTEMEQRGIITNRRKTSNGKEVWDLTGQKPQEDQAANFLTTAVFLSNHAGTIRPQDVLDKAARDGVINEQSLREAFPKAPLQDLTQILSQLETVGLIVPQGDMQWGLNEDALRETSQTVGETTNAPPSGGVPDVDAAAAPATGGSDAELAPRPPTEGQATADAGAAGVGVDSTDAGDADVRTEEEPATVEDLSHLSDEELIAAGWDIGQNSSNKTAVEPQAEVTPEKPTPKPAADPYRTGDLSFISLANKINELKKAVSSQGLLADLVETQELLEDKGKPNVPGFRAVRDDVNARINDVIAAENEYRSDPHSKQNIRIKQREASNIAASERAQTEIAADQIVPGSVEIERKEGPYNPQSNLIAKLRESKSISSALQWLDEQIVKESAKLRGEFGKIAQTEPVDVDKTTIQGQDKSGKAKTKKVKEKLTAAERAAKRDWLTEKRGSKYSRANAKAMRQLAKLGVRLGLIGELQTIDFGQGNVQIETDANADKAVFDRMRKERKVAEYDPRTNTFYFTEAGVTPSILLHEAVHAATVRVIHQYFVDPSKLKPEQREAVEHLQKIMQVSKKKLGESYKNAYENLFEFVSYALTNNRFQTELSKLRTPSLTKYTAGQKVMKGLADLWSQFTEALMNMYGLYRHVADEVTKRPLITVSVEGTGKKVRRTGIGTYKGITTLNTNVEGNPLIEASEAFSRILSAPEAGTEVEPLAKRKSGRKKPNRMRAPYMGPETMDGYNQYTLDKQQENFENKHRTLIKISKFFLGADGYNWLVKKFQNDRRFVKVLVSALDMMGVLNSDVNDEGFNNVHSALVNGTQKAFQYNRMFVEPNVERVEAAIDAYAKANNMTYQIAANELSNMFKSLNEQERRHFKFLENVPLDNESSITLPEYGNKKFKSAADARTWTLDDAASEKPKFSAKVHRQVLERLAKDHKSIKPTAISPLKPRVGVTPEGLMNEDHESYSAIVEMTPKIARELRQRYYNELKGPNGATLREAKKAIEDLQASTKELNRISGFWAPQVDHIVEMYGWDNYITFAGKEGSYVGPNDQKYEIFGKSLSGEYVQAAERTLGRAYDPGNAIHRTYAEATMAATRAARAPVTKAVKNLIKQKYINGQQVKKGMHKGVIKFKDRYRDTEDLRALKGEGNIFHYMPNGDIEVYAIDDKEIREAVRRPVRKPSPFIDAANHFTGFLGHMHTRYNPAFHPYNFVRDMLTNAYNIGAEWGIGSTKDYITEVTSTIFENGAFAKSAKVSRMYADGKLKELEALAKTDPYVKNLYEYIQRGGRIAFIMGLAADQQTRLAIAEAEKGNVKAATDILNKYVDIWADMFEFTSRAAAYKVAKERFMNKEGLSETAASEKAVTFAKELANFESVGEWGRAAGGLFMFFRPAATGAVRAIDAFQPVFMDAEAAYNQLPQRAREEAGEAGKKAFMEKYAQRQENAKVMLWSLMGAGAFLYFMMTGLSEDDEQGRKRVATDDKALWVRNLRIPLRGIGGEENKYLQIPWGFGMGAFMAGGAQMMALGMGHAKLRETFANMINIGLDSYVPLPISRTNPIDQPLQWSIDSLAPSFARPFIEFSWNLDALGRRIYSDRPTRYGDPFTGTSRAPEIFGASARLLADITNAEVLVEPNTLYFWANNYLDGVAKVANNMWGLSHALAGLDDFDIKNDIPGVSSFIGKKSDVDAREWAAIDEQMRRKMSTLSMLQNRGDADQTQRYLARHPNDPLLVYVFKQVENQLKPLRMQRNYIEQANFLPDPETRELVKATPRIRKHWLEVTRREQGFIKRNYIDAYKSYNINP